MSATEAVACATCLAPLPPGHDPADGRAPCPTCGSTARAYSVALHDEIQVHEQLGWKQKRLGHKRPIAEGRLGDSFHHDTGRWSVLNRVIDRLSDW